MDLGGTPVSEEQPPMSLMGQSLWECREGCVCACMCADRCWGGLCRPHTQGRERDRGLGTKTLKGRRDQGSCLPELTWSSPEGVGRGIREAGRGKAMAISYFQEPGQNS